MTEQFSLVFLASPLTRATPSLTALARASILHWNIADRRWLRRGMHVLGHRQMRYFGCCRSGLRSLHKMHPSWWRAKPPGTTAYVAAPWPTSVTAIWFSCLPIALPPSPFFFLYNIVVLELERGEAAGRLCWQIRRDRSFWHEQGSKFMLLFWSQGNFTLGQDLATLSSSWEWGCLCHLIMLFKMQISMKAQWKH